MSNDDDNEIISINVGGTLFSTTKKTILPLLPEFYARINRGDLIVRKDSRGNIFFDRNPRIFEMILEFLRTGILYENNLICTREQLENEAKYYGATALLDILNKKRKTTKMPRYSEVPNVGSREAIIFNTIDGMVRGPAVAIKLDSESTQSYFFKANREGSPYRDVQPYLITSKGRPLWTEWPGLEQGKDYERRGCNSVTVVLTKLCARDLISWLKDKRSVLFYVLGGLTVSAFVEDTYSRGSEPTTNSMMVTEQKVLQDWDHYFNNATEKGEIVYKIVK